MRRLEVQMWSSDCGHVEPEFHTHTSLELHQWRWWFWLPILLWSSTEDLVQQVLCEVLVSPSSLLFECGCIEPEINTGRLSDHTSPPPQPLSLLDKLSLRPFAATSSSSSSLEELLVHMCALIPTPRSHLSDPPLFSSASFISRLVSLQSAEVLAEGHVWVLEWGLLWWERWGEGEGEVVGEHVGELDGILTVSGSDLSSMLHRDLLPCLSCLSWQLVFRCCLKISPVNGYQETHGTLHIMEARIHALFHTHTTIALPYADWSCPI